MIKTSETGKSRSNIVLKVISKLLVASASQGKYYCNKTKNISTVSSLSIEEMFFSLNFSNFSFLDSVYLFIVVFKHCCFLFCKGKKNETGHSTL